MSKVILYFHANEQKSEECSDLPGFLSPGALPLLPLTLSPSSFCTAVSVVSSGLLLSQAFHMRTTSRLTDSSLPLAQLRPLNSQWLETYPLEFPSNWVCQLLLVITFLGPDPTAFHLSRTWSLAPGCICSRAFWKIQMASARPQPNWPEMKNVVISNQHVLPV